MFLTGSLPWKQSEGTTKNERYSFIMRLKESTSMEDLCENCPIEFLKFMKYVKALKFEEKPDYEYMINLFTDLAKREKFDLHDKIYDWNVRAVTIQSRSYFFDFIKNDQAHPFNKDGRFHLSIINSHLDPEMKKEEE